MMIHKAECGCEIFLLQNSSEDVIFFNALPNNQTDFDPIYHVMQFTTISIIYILTISDI